LRANIEIDGKLLSEAMKASGLATKRETVEEGLRLQVSVRGQKQGFEELRGLVWEGDLDKMRQGWSIDDRDSGR